MNKLIYAFFIIGLVINCTPNHEYQEINQIKESTWNRNNKQTFEYTPDTNHEANVYFLLRNNSSYPFQNIFVFSSTEKSNSILRDTLEYELADEFGNWHGNGMGEVKEILLLFKKNFKFQKDSTIKFAIQQAMRKEDLPGIEDIGLIITKEGL